MNISRLFFVMGLVVLPLRACLAGWDDPAYEFRPVRSVWDGLKHEAVFGAGDYQPQPEPAVLAGLRVEWREVAVQPSYNKLLVRGRLVAPASGGRAQTIDWLQGVRVLAARNPALQPDWSRGHTATDTAVADAVLGADDRFVAQFELRSFPRPVGSRERFQFAAVLPQATVIEGTHARVVWTAERPIVPGSVTRLTIPGPPRLSPTLGRINAAAVFSGPRDAPHGTQLIRAVNHLHGMGKDRALAALKEYCELSDDGFGHRDVPPDPANVETGDNTIVFWIARLLFEPTQAGTRIPEPMIAVAALGPEKPDRDLWPLDPLELMDDVPFLVGESIAIGGHPEHPAMHLPWIERHCVLRESPLVPADDPLAVADRLLSLPKSVRRRLPEQEIRQQAWHMVADVLPTVKPRADSDGPVTDTTWRILRRSAQQRHLRWDPQRQQYVVDAEGRKG